MNELSRGRTRTTRFADYAGNALVAFAYPTIFVLITGTLIVALAAGANVAR